MGAPSTAITRLDLSLTYQEFSLLANQMKFIGLLVLPPLGVEQEAADFAKIKISSLLSKVEETLTTATAGNGRRTSTAFKNMASRKRLTMRR